VAYFLFIDESGQDHRDSPYEVLAGIAVEDKDLWNLVQAIHNLELRFFGRRYSSGRDELKAKKILKRKVYRLAAQMPPIPELERTKLAHECLDFGESATRPQLTALAQAKIAYVDALLDICADFRCRLFASIVQPGSSYLEEDSLRKDYTYLFERFFYFLEDSAPSQQGVVVFDELEKSRSHILVEQMYSYFKVSAKGRMRAGRVIPEPFFVHSELTTGIQLADIAAYLLSFGFRTKELTEPARTELLPLVEKTRALRYKAVREIQDNPNFGVWSIAIIRDLRPRNKRNTGL
jgi:hypothetical protein